MTTCLLLASVQRIDAFTASPYKGHHFGSRMHPRLIRRHNSADNTILTQMVEESIIETQKLHRFYEKAHYVAPVVWNSRTIAAEYLEATIDTVLFDCDGVLYRTMDACPGASKVIGRLISSGRKVLFVTNNAGVSRRQLREKLVNVLGIQSLSKEQMVSSSYSCTRYLMQKLKSGSRVHVIGSQGLCEELENSGFHVTGGPSNENNNASMDREELASYNFDEHPIDALAVGHDTQFTFRKLSIANNLLLRNPNSFFVATNHDSFDLGKYTHFFWLALCSLRASLTNLLQSARMVDIFQAMVALCGHWSIVAPELQSMLVSPARR